ncbi:hypothetical protein Mag101_04890 [Microbulbifer agarilyticus]|uniref:Uncharacterized protein n=1 Tax=Microbulbifer agarilyticus TaxID=260552 RepID=A0A1Q2M2Z5_9GAMM|nr:hypothetical protein Mag101_04890 [Microbulbifer agarilyticus]
MYGYINLKSKNLNPLLAFVKIIHAVSIALFVLIPLSVIPATFAGISQIYVLSFLVYPFWGYLLAGILAVLIAF